MENWEYGGIIFSTNETFWGTGYFWAPELHLINGKYYLFATFRGESNPYHRCHAPNSVSEHPELMEIQISENEIKIL